MKKIIPVILFLSLVSCFENPKMEENQQNEYPAIADSLTSELNAIWEEGQIVGFSVALVDEYEIFYEKGFGYADAEKNEKYSENTLQNIASISKTFIGISLLKAQEMGQLQLDDPVNQYLPFEVKNPFHPHDKITIRHLATHTSSITDTEFYYEKSYILKDEPSIDIPKPKDPGITYNPPDSAMLMIDYLEKVLSPEGLWYRRSGFLDNKPGDIYRYSNVGATLAAAVLESATGESFDSYTARYVFQPLNMVTSGWSFKAIDFSKHTKLYREENIEIPFYSLITYPDGGLITSSHDLGIYLRELINGYYGGGELLTSTGYSELFEPQLNPAHFLDPEEYNEFNEGIFMSILTNGFIGHSGGDPGVSTFMYINTATRTGRILLVNTELDSIGEKQFYSIINKLGHFENKLLASRGEER